MQNKPIQHKIRNNYTALQEKINTKNYFPDHHVKSYNASSGEYRFNNECLQACFKEITNGNSLFFYIIKTQCGELSIEFNNTKYYNNECSLDFFMQYIIDTKDYAQDNSSLQCMPMNQKLKYDNKTQKIGDVYDTICSFYQEYLYNKLEQLYTIHCNSQNILEPNILKKNITMLIDVILNKLEYNSYEFFNIIENLNNVQKKKFIEHLQLDINHNEGITYNLNNNTKITIQINNNTGVHHYTVEIISGKHYCSVVKTERNINNVSPQFMKLLNIFINSDIEQLKNLENGIQLLVNVLPFNTELKSHNEDGQCLIQYVDNNKIKLIEIQLNEYRIQIFNNFLLECENCKTKNNDDQLLEPEMLEPLFEKVYIKTILNIMAQKFFNQDFVSLDTTTNVVKILGLFNAKSNQAQKFIASSFLFYINKHNLWLQLKEYLIVEDNYNQYLFEYYEDNAKKTLSLTNKGLMKGLFNKEDIHHITLNKYFLSNLCIKLQRLYSNMI